MPFDNSHMADRRYNGWNYQNAERRDMKNKSKF
jgi:hypothetical protein